MNGPGWTSLLWFVAILVMIPVALRLLKRTPMGGAAGGTGLRSIAALPLSNTQRIVTIEVGQGDERRWLILGVTPNSINALYSIAPQGEPGSATGLAGASGDTLPNPPTGFGQLLSRLRQNPMGTAVEN